MADCYCSRIGIVFTKWSSMKYILEELGGRSPVVGIEGSGGVVRMGVCRFEKNRNSPFSNNLLLAVGVGGVLSAL